VQKTVIALEELSVAYRPVYYDLFEGDRQTIAFNGSETAFAVFKSGAVLQDLADKARKNDELRTHSRMMLETFCRSGTQSGNCQVVRISSAMKHGLRVGFLRNRKRKGQFDPGLDADVAARVILGVMKGMRALSLRNPDSDITRNLDMPQTLIARSI